MKWTIDPAHSNVEFTVRHMGISTIRGRFKHVHRTIEATEDGRLQRIEASIAARSIDTAVPERDTHLLSPDFLDAANYREVTFRSTAVEALGGGRYRVHGDHDPRRDSLHGL